MPENIAFFFGAGAECGEDSFGLPSGTEYTIKTMQQRHGNLYNKLKAFYLKRMDENYVKEYRRSFLFEKDSHTFREILYRAALRCIEESDSGKKISAESEKFVEAVRKQEKLEKQRYENTSEEMKKAKDAVKNEVGALYELIVKDADSAQVNECQAENEGQDNLISIKDYITFYGAVEKDFSSIINPNKIGLTQFWRVINYYWSAYFTILLPLCKEFSWYHANERSQENYEYILSNLNAVIDDIYGNYNYALVEQKRGNYYSTICREFKSCAAMTTNYTPFVQHYFDKSIYLAGQLSEFEFPTEMEIRDLRKHDLKDNSFIFPFIMTQAPIKPIVSPVQLEQYSKALEVLSESDTLVIIGYSIGDADNHINAMLHRFALEENKRIVYCCYSKDDGDCDAERKRIMER